MPDAGRIPSLDVLRGIAILTVVFGHFIPARIALGQAAYHVSSLGRGGVLLFFLLSGYLVFRNIEKQDPLTFISRRLFKIFPAYWVNVVVIALFSLMAGHQAFSLATVLGNFFMVQDVFRMESLNGVYWTLLIEVKFYLFLACQHFLLRDRGPLAVLAGLVCTNIVVWLLRGHASLLLTFFPVFYVGIHFPRAAPAVGFLGAQPSVDRACRGVDHGNCLRLAPSGGAPHGGVRQEARASVVGTWSGRGTIGSCLTECLAK